MSQTPTNNTNSRSEKALEIQSALPLQAKLKDPKQQKLVELPESVWDMLRSLSYYIPKGDFSTKFFARKLLHFSFVKDITMEARKLLFIYLCREMFTFDTTICNGFAEVVYNEADKNLLLNIADKMEELEANVNQPKASKVEEEEYSEQAA